LSTNYHKRGDFINYYCKKTHGVPALFSFFIPGLGQLVKGDLSKAVGIWVALIISAFMSVIGIGFLMAMVVWVAQIYDAYNA
jgi:hypothetical protein